MTDPTASRALVQDCEVLLAAKDRLRGAAALNWSASTAIAGWEGITTSGTPSRVTVVELPGESLSGSIPAGLGMLFELTTLDLSMNSLTGDIPAELGSLYNLEELRLSGNSLTGCIPLALRDVATNDVGSLSLPYCTPPAPENFSAGTPGETGIALSWDSVANASKYRVEYRTVASGGWVVDDDTITGTAHTVGGLACETTHLIWVKGYGSGTVYAAAWSEPSITLAETTSACTSTSFDPDS